MNRLTRILKRVKFSYESREDLVEDYDYCKNILIADGKKD